MRGIDPKKIRRRGDGRGPNRQHRPIDGVEVEQGLELADRRGRENQFENLDLGTFGPILSPLETSYFLDDLFENY